MIKIDIPYPNDCYECKLSYMDREDCDVYCPTNGWVHLCSEERHPNCPLIECEEGK